MKYTFALQSHNQYMLSNGLGLLYLGHFQQYFSYIVVVSFIGSRNRSTQKKPTDLS
jgi:hypothetical protein